MPSNTNLTIDFAGAGITGLQVLRNANSYDHYILIERSFYNKVGRLLVGHFSQPELAMQDYWLFIYGSYGQPCHRGFTAWITGYPSMIHTVNHAMEDLHILIIQYM